MDRRDFAGTVASRSGKVAFQSAKGEIGFPKGEFLMLRTILIIFLVLALLGSLPAWPYSTAWGYYPSGGLGLVLLVVLVFWLLDRPSAV
jgi:hypothetical protein